MDEISVRKVSELLDVSYPTALNFAHEHGRRVDGHGRYGKFLVPVDAVREELKRKRSIIEKKVSRLNNLDASPALDDIQEKRAAEMVHLRENELLTLQEIGDKFGISRERVRQIIGNTGHGYVAQRNHEAMLDTLDMTNAEAADHLGVSVNTASKYRRDYRTPVESDCPVGVGREWEDYAIEDLRKRGIGCEGMLSRSSFDILLDNGMRVDVKFSGADRRKTSPRIKSPQWSFGVGRGDKRDDCDFYYCITEEKDVFIIPAEAIPKSIDILTFCYPTMRPKIGKYQKYHERYDLLMPTPVSPNGSP